MLFKVKSPEIVNAEIVEVIVTVRVVATVVGNTPEPRVTEEQLSIPEPAIVAATFAAAALFKVTAPVTVKVTLVIVKVAAVPVKVNDAIALAGVTVKTGWFVTAGIFTTSPLADPGFPFGDQFVVVAQAVLVVPVHV